MSNNKRKVSLMPLILSAQSEVYGPFSNSRSIMRRFMKIFTFLSLRRLKQLTAFLLIFTPESRDLTFSQHI